MSASLGRHRRHLPPSCGWNGPRAQSAVARLSNLAARPDDQAPTLRHSSINSPPTIQIRCARAARPSLLETRQPNLSPEESPLILQLRDWDSAGINVRVNSKSATSDERANPVQRAISESDERIVLDLHAGESFERDHLQIAMPEILVLRPMEIVRIHVLETLETSDNVFGVVCSRASLAAEGLLVSNLKVDPKFHGSLQIAVVNVGGRAIRIKKGQPFAGLWFATLSHPLEGSDPARIPTESQGIDIRAWQETLRSIRPYLITAIVSIVFALAAAELLKI